MLIFWIKKVLAYIILNLKSIDVVLFGSILINNWRWFMIACAQPSFITAFLLLLLPESPKYCLHVSLKKNSKSKEKSHS